MIKSLDQTLFYNELKRREDSAAKTFCGLLIPIATTAESNLAFIKHAYPYLTEHDLQHSFRILDYLYEITNIDMRSDLSSVEIFCLIMAAFFHDMGMAIPNLGDKIEQRNNHHQHAGEFIDRYFKENLKIINNSGRFKPCINFVCEAHGMQLEVFYKHPLFKRIDRIDFQIVRYALLGVLLRIGDLMDMEENRTNAFMLKFFPSYFDEEAREHHLRHMNINFYNYGTELIEIEVSASNKAQYLIWENWLKYLHQEILYANTNLMPSKIKYNFPPVQYKILPLNGSMFNVEELRFELDDKGAIWNIISNSVYTKEFDYVRELIQNAIDASLLRIYFDESMELKCSSPRSWNIIKCIEPVIIAYSHKRQQIAVVDSGCGMNQNEVKKFLFKVADSGYRDLCCKRSFSFQSIAKFGIGFISCLNSARQISIFTSREPDENLNSVSLSDGANIALLEQIHVKHKGGTCIALSVKNEPTSEQLIAYLNQTFCYTSVQIKYVDIDRLKAVINEINSFDDSNFCINLDLLSDNYFDLRDEIEKAELIHKDFCEPKRNSYKSLLKDSALLDEYKAWLSINKFEYASRQLKQILPYLSLMVRSIENENLLQMINNFRLKTPQYIKENTIIEAAEELYHQCDTYIQKERGDINTFLDKYQLNNYSISTEFFETNPYTICAILLTDGFRLHDVYFDEDIPNLCNKTGILLINTEFSDFNYGIEWSSINCFLFHDGSIVNEIAKFDGYIENEYSNHRESLEPIIVVLREDEYFEDSVRNAYNNGYGDRYDDKMVLKPIFETLYLSENGIRYDDDIGINDLDNDEENSQDFLLNIKKSSEISVEKVDIISKIATLPSSLLYQDGIYLDVKINQITPYGMCKAKANFTGEARFELNVTRHSISENVDHIENWFCNIGSIIQNTVVYKINEVLSKYGMDYDENTLIMTYNDNSSWARQCKQTAKNAYETSVRELSAK